jgi:hypothetical protein
LQVGVVLIGHGAPRQERREHVDHFRKALLWQKGDGPAAMQAFQESMTLSRITGNQAILSFAMSRLGIVEMYTDEPNDFRRRFAKKLFQAALGIYQQVGNVQEH